MARLIFAKCDSWDDPIGSSGFVTNMKPVGLRQAAKGLRMPETMQCNGAVRKGLMFFERDGKPQSKAETDAFGVIRCHQWFA